MAKFFYRAKKGVHEIVEGVVEASHVHEAVSKVVQQGLSPLDVDVFQEKKQKITVPFKTLFTFDRPHVSQKQIVAFTRQMHDLIDAGIPLLRALRLLAEQDWQSPLQGILVDIANMIQDGGSLSEGLTRYPETFSPLYVNLIKSGESSGHLGTVLGRLADFLEKSQEVSQKALTSFIYPSLILAVGSITVFVLLSFVVPRLTDMFDELSQRLPWPTVFLISVSDLFARFWWLIIMILAGSFFYVQHLYRIPQKRIKMDALQLRLFLVGPFIVKLEVVRFSQTLATLLDGGVPIVEALRNVVLVIGNHALREDLSRLADEVAGGASLTESLKNVHFFPSTAINMVAVGEESGQLEKALYKIASSYERQTDQVIRAITSLLEPVLIVAIGAVIGFVVVAMLLPIFQMNLIIQ
ncbi:MAG TPA: type II secretion system F family protein [Candidatus Omnitrophota bacterium]|nr:type II secretion system F family protein [Candidatus Omnitrophota bacterium]HQL41253.1 type II secretion system F family protein [Candidatus Omnitrophota bacterium]